MKNTHIHRWLFCAAISLVLFLQLPLRAEAAYLEGAREAILECCLEGREKVDLTYYSLTPEQLQTIFDDLDNSGQLPWYCTYYRLSTYSDTGLVAYFFPARLDPAEYDYALYEQTVAEILAETVHPGMSDWQIALSIHDYLAANAAYDESITYRSGYDLLVRGTAVCRGYAEAYQDLLLRAGIPCRYVSSKEMDHAWNLVQIGGNWYHVDVTWDDPISNIQGRVQHEYFLLSDYAISDEDHEHFGWATDIACTDTTLDEDRFWQDVASQICYLDAYTSYVRYYDEGAYNIYLRDEVTGELTVFGWLDPNYIDIGYGSYNYYNHGLSLWNGRVYYSDMECVYSRLPDGSDWRVEYTLPVYDYYKVICGSFVKDGTIFLQLKDHENEMLTITVPTLDQSWHSHSYSAQMIPATCLAPGGTLHSCSCGISYTTDPTPLADHSYGQPQTVEPADATHTGLVAYTCSICGHQITEETPRLGQESLFSGNGSLVEKIIGFLDAVTQSKVLLPLLIIAIVISARSLKKRKK